MTLNVKQMQQVLLQIQSHTHAKYEIDIGLSNGNKFAKFIVHPNVVRPEVMTSMVLARYLHTRPHLFRGKRVIDMGCGAGLQGAVMSLGRASHVTFVDVSEAAVKNTAKNIRKFGLKKTLVLKSNLFKKITAVTDVIVFNHPFFPAKPFPKIPISKSMLDEGTLIQRFLIDAKKYLKKGGIIIMPYFDLAGQKN